MSRSVEKIEARIAEFRAYPDPELVTLDQLNNFEGNLPGGFMRSLVEKGTSAVKDLDQKRKDFYAEDDAYRGRSPQQIYDNLRLGHGDSSLEQTHREFYRTLEQVLYKHVTPDEYQRLHKIVPFAASREGGKEPEYYEAREKLGEILLAAYKELRAMEYTHLELIS